MTKNHDHSPSHSQETTDPASVILSSKLLDKRIMFQTGSRYDALHPAWITARYQEAHNRRPELAEWLITSGTDGLHATQSGSLRSILDRGIIPQSQLSSVSHPVTSVEFHSVGESRKSIHMVHWLYAEEIKRYAEEPYEPLTLKNIDEAILGPEQFAFFEKSPLNEAQHYVKRHAAAIALKEYLQSPDVDYEYVKFLKANFPIIFGIRSTDLDQSKISVPDRSIVRGDVQYGESIVPSALTCLFVPVEQITQVSKLTDKPVFALEDLRTMTDNLY